MINQNNQNSNWKKLLGLGLRNMQEKLENVQLYIRSVKTTDETKRKKNVVNPMDFVIIVKIRFLSDQYSNLPLTQWTNMKKLLFQSIYFCKSCQLKCPKNISLRSVCSTDIYNMVSYTTKKVAYTNKSKSNPHKYYNKGFFFAFP